MILSHELRCIFIKTNKTAGTSFEIALSRYCGDEDIITPISPEDEEIRKRLGTRGPQHYRPARREYTLAQRIHTLRTGKPVEFYNHMSAVEVRELVGSRVWRSYYKFCFERNPWDRVISAYYWQSRGKPELSLTEFIHSEGARLLKRRGSGLYMDQGKLLVDRVYKYEDMAASLEHIQRKLNLPGPLELPHAKSEFRKDRRPFSEVLSRQDQECVRSMFSAEIELNGYDEYLSADSAGPGIRLAAASR